MIWWFIVTLAGGLIIGSLGKLVAPGDRDHIPLWLTVACGIGGMLVGSLVYFALFGVGASVEGDSGTAGTTPPRVSTGGGTSGRSPRPPSWWCWPPA